MLQGFESKGTPSIQAAPLSTASVKANEYASQALGSKLEQFKSFKDAQLDRQAKTNAEEQARKDSQEGKPFNKLVNNTYGSVYNNVRTASYSAEAELQLASKSDELATQYENDPEGYNNSFQEFSKGLSTSAPTRELQDVIAITGDKRRTSVYGNLKVAEHNRIKTATVDTFKRSIDLNVNQIIQLKSQGDTNRANDEITKNITYINSMVKDGYITQKDAQVLTRDGNYKITYGVAVNTMENLVNKPSLEEAKVFLDKETSVNRTDMDVPQNEKYVDDLTKMYNSAVKSRKAIASGFKEEANLILTKVNDIMAVGKTPPPDLLSQAQEYSQYASLSKQDAFKTQYDAYNIVKKFDHLTLPEQESALSSFKSSPGMSNVDVKVMGAIEKNLSTRKAEAKKDPQSLSVIEGLNQPTPAMNISNGIKAVFDTLPQRAKNQTANMLEYGPNATQLFTDAEATEWGGFLEDANTPISKKLEFMDAVIKSAPNKVNAVFNQLRKKGASTFSYAASMMAENKPEVARGILRGQELLKEVGTQDYVKEYKTTVASKVGNAMVFAAPEDFGALVDSSLAYSLFLAEKKGDITDLRGLSERQGINDLTNGMHKRNGQDFFLPQNVDQDDFDEWIDDTLTTADFSNVKGFTPEQALNYIQGDKVRIVSVGTGKYAFYDSMGNQIKNIDGTPFKLEK
jgi:hypothetical protein